MGSFWKDGGSCHMQRDPNNNICKNNINRPINPKIDVLDWWAWKFRSTWTSQ